MKILIAEDESIIRMGLKSMLEGLGHTVWAAMNGREALALTRKEQFDLAILDIKMPYTDGLQTANAISKHTPMPILLLTAHSDTELVEKASDLPIQGYLVKPIQREELNAAITVATKRFEEAHQLEDEKERLAKALTDRKVVEKAKGRLIESGLSEDEAYRWLQKYARDHQQTMAQSAWAIIKATDK